MTALIKVLVAEDNQLMRIGIAGALADAADMQVVGTADNGAQAVTLFSELLPDVVLMDLNMPHMDGLQAIRGIIRADAHARILVLSHYEGSEQLLGSLEAGALGYLTKDERADGILLGIRAVARGEKYFMPHMAGRLDSVSNQPVLTLRERQVLERLVGGASNRDIARQLGLSHKTVSIYVSNLLEKLRVANRTEAATAAVSRGLLSRTPR